MPERIAGLNSIKDTLAGVLIDAQRILHGSCSRGEEARIRRILSSGEVT